MKFFVAFVALMAVAAATPLFKMNKPITNQVAELEAIIAAIQSPSTDPATAALLEEQLAAIIAENISVGPAIIETSPVSIGPEIIDFPLPEATPVAPAPVVQPSPVVVGEVPAGSSPLVQIIVNVNGQPLAPGGVAPAPVDTPVIEEVYVPGPVNVVDNVFAPEEVITPVQVLEPVIPTPVVLPAPVIVGNPIIPSPAGHLPGVDVY